MDFSGNVTIQAPREAVWEFLTEPDQVSTCAPGLESLTVIAPGERFEVVAAVGFGTVKVRFVTDVKWTELDAPHRARMVAHGTAPGSAVDVQASMELAEQGPEITQMTWTAQVTVSGTITSLASRLMGSVTKKVTNAFFDCVRKQVES